MPAVEITSIIKDAIQNLKNIGLTAVICDQATTNIKALHLLGATLDPLGGEDSHCILMGVQRVPVVFDVPHLLKSIRNNLFKYGIKRRYRARRDEDAQRRQQYLDKERERWRKDIETGKKKTQKDLSAREQRVQRKKQREAGMKRRRAAKAKSARKLLLLEEKMKKAKTRIEMYKKRIQRLTNNNPSPRTKVNKLVRHLSAISLKRTLLFHSAVVEGVRAKYANAKRQSDKQIIAGIATNKILKKYRMQKLAEEVFGFSTRRWKERENPCKYERKKHEGVGAKLRSTVTSFFLRDDVSRFTTGKKQTVTRQKKKRQKRLLTDTLKNLYLKFLAEHPNLRLSFSLFCTFRPYWVVRPTLADRDTCMCKQHDNLGFIARKLYQQHVRRHLFNIRQQYAFARALKLNLPSDECVIHVDFAENYCCKYSSEIQAVHFGMSHQQAVLHTGVCYVGSESPFSFTSVSASRLKGPPAIWQHLDPILKDKFSRWDFTRGTWNFFEASHGKGAPDGVGGSLKRRADRLVSQGVDIATAFSLYQALCEGESKVSLFYIQEQAVEDAVSTMPTNLPSIPSTMMIHQVLTLSPGKILYWDISCLCSATGNLQCECQETKSFSLNPTDARKDVLWCHISNFYEIDKLHTIRMAPKLTERHISLPAFSKMRVSLATQVFSHTVSAGISAMVSLKRLPAEANDTGEFIAKINRLFDVLNSS
ncbi:hypothetical protein N1851_007764 [Merluccius polli]|uniref:Transposable element P transposase-like GTP-binding insertion domain-containing protein n=1 Tax=Merluccius polli TaxID=89951 RepID=A0AA47N296_MERPO|nr:hypothetical protein N1851_007764 [Merluccius polli]